MHITDQELVTLLKTLISTLKTEGKISVHQSETALKTVQLYALVKSGIFLNVGLNFPKVVATPTDNIVGFKKGDTK
jgi:hypothetical protein